MSLKYYLWWMTAGTLGAWAVLWLVMKYLDPQSTGFLGLLLFYVAVFLSVTGTLTIFGFTWRMFRFKDEVLFRHMTQAFRQGAMLALVVVGALFLEAQKLLTWWNLGLLILGLTLLEFFWLSVKRMPPADV